MAAYTTGRAASHNQRSTPSAKVPDNTVNNSTTPRVSVKRSNLSKPLQSNTLGNLQPTINSSKDHNSQSDIEDMLIRLYQNDSRRSSSTENKSTAMAQRYAEVECKNDSVVNTRENDQSSISGLFTPATDSFVGSMKADAKELARMKEELEAARSIISRQRQELEATRSFKHTMDQALSTPTEVDFPHAVNGHSTTNGFAQPLSLPRGNIWPSHDDYHEMIAGNGANVTGFGRHRYGQAIPHVGGYRSRYEDESSLTMSARTFSGSSVGALSDMTSAGHRAAARQVPIPIQVDHGFGSSYSSPMATVSPFSALTNNPVALYDNSDLSARMAASQFRIGSPTSLDDYTTAAGLVGMTSPYTQTFSQANTGSLEPTNYRRLLDKSVSCDWKHIVDKIVCNNDQQASIFLQQKLKVGTAEQKFEIVEAIINQAYPLMINRFGNFLVQRCFEHGTVEQVTAIADSIHGNVISLSMDPFGCHVVQKAFDSVPESHKADMVRELLRRIPDTVIHRYACHVWQKLFELRWSSEPPQIMTKVNAALVGMWHEVALGETGSLVVQNIFENCVEEEKRPAINEVIDKIDLIAHGQFGNWCIQHLCEHATPQDKRKVIDHILTNAYSYSIDQYASKVVEKCLKISGLDFLDRYLTVITTAHPDRPRIPLIDIAGDQYGNYLIQWILMNTHQQHREQVAVHIRKHMVSLRGSKFGSRVAMLCCNPASITRPGSSTIVNPYGAPGQPRNTFTRFH